MFHAAQSEKCCMPSDKIMFKRNRWRNTSYFMIGTPKKPGLSPKKQKQYDAEILGFLPLLPEKYFKEKPELKHTVSTIKSHFAPKSNLMTRSAARALGSNTGTTSVTVNDPFCQPVNNDDKPEGLTKLRMGLVILDLDLDVEWMNHVVEHVLKCKKAKLDVLENKLFGAEIVTTYQCRFCKEELVKRQSPDDNRPAHPGIKGSAVNLNLAPAIFSSGTNVQKALELFAEAGIQCLSAHVMQDLVDKVKKSISDLSEEQL